MGSMDYLHGLLITRLGDIEDLGNGEKRRCVFAENDLHQMVAFHAMNGRVDDLQEGEIYDAWLKFSCVEENNGFRWDVVLGANRLARLRNTTLTKENFYWKPQYYKTIQED